MADWSRVVSREVVITGAAPNAVVVDDEALLIVNSFDNTLQRVDLATGTSAPAFVNVGAEQGPFDVAVAGERIFISLNASNSIAIADRLTGELLDVVSPGLERPQDMVVLEAQGLLVVANTAFDQNATARFGSLVLLDLEDPSQVIQRIETTQSNPQFLVVHEDRLLVVNRGRSVFSGVVVPETALGVDIFTLATLRQATAPDLNLSLGEPVGLVGLAGRPAVIDDILYLGSGTAPVLFKVDLSTDQVLADTRAPVVVYDAEESNAWVQPFAGPGGLLYLLDFNRDRVLVMDPSTDALIGEGVDVGTNPEQTEGPIDLAWRGCDAFVVTSLSGALTRINLYAL